MSDDLILDLRPIATVAKAVSEDVSPVKKTYDALKSVLHVSAKNVLMVGRQSELSAIQEFVRICISDKIGSSLYISGLPGSGKTACVHQICENLLKKEDISFIWLNGMSNGNTERIVQALQEHSSKAVRKFDQPKKIVARTKSNDKMM